MSVATFLRSKLLRAAGSPSAARGSWQVFAAALLLCGAGAGCAPGAGAAPSRSAPEFVGTGAWFNTSPLTMADLRGKVVLVEFWTYGCINCLHVLPELKRWHAQYARQGLVVVGVHTPESDEEYDPVKVKAAVDRLGITYPVVLDNGYKTWDAYRNQYWPALYLVDRKGNVVYRHYGEGDYDATEGEIRRLLADP